jgi:iron-sulfur cluster repair protein YtfE (RIC family)
MTTPGVPDPTRELEHDHVRFSKHVSGLRALAEAAQGSGGLSRSLLQLREELFLHFAREEEGLFPFVATHLPGTRETVDRLVASHDGLCGSLSRMVHLVQRSKPGELAQHETTFMELLDRFESLYTKHSLEEVTFLRELGPRLTVAQRQELEELVRGL